MSEPHRDTPPPRAGDALLFTPGPLTTSLPVKRAMLRDLGSRDAEFIAVVADVRRRLLEVGRVASPRYEAVPLQGSGTFALEAVVATFTGDGSGRWLVAENGAYGRRFVEIARLLGVEATAVSFPEDRPVDPAAVERALAADPGLSHVAVVHCETTTGVLNPVRRVGEVVARFGRRLFVDAMSSFGGVELDVAGAGIHALATSANKCLEGVPGLSLVIARRDELRAAEGRARTLCLDLAAQWRGLERDGQFRFTPPTHAILALGQALRELDEEGGVAGRAARYADNHRVLEEGMAALGFAAFLEPRHRSHVISTYRYLDHPRFSFGALYDGLRRRGKVIYPGKVGNDPRCFRVGTIGRLFVDDIRALLAAMGEVLAEMGVA